MVCWMFGASSPNPGDRSSWVTGLTGREITIPGRACAASWDGVSGDREVASRWGSRSNLSHESDVSIGVIPSRVTGHSASVGAAVSSGAVVVAAVPKSKSGRGDGSVRMCPLRRVAQKVASVDEMGFESAPQRRGRDPLRLQDAPDREIGRALFAVAALPNSLMSWRPSTAAWESLWTPKRMPNQLRGSLHYGSLKGSRAPRDGTRPAEPDGSPRETFSGSRDRSSTAPRAPRWGLPRCWPIPCRRGA
jgi:hypothetical protein